MRAWFLIILLIFVSPSVAADKLWHWIKAGNTTEEWFVQQGSAEVSIEGDKFTAKLFTSSSDKNLLILLNGQIKNGKITARETIQGSDYTGSAYEGTFNKKKWENFAGTIGEESITLSDGWSMIGIKRTLLK